MELRNLYFMWCEQKGFKPSNGEALTQFVNIINKD